MKEWILNHANHIYWLVTADLFKKAFNENMPADEAIPLLCIGQFKDLMPMSPWLVPAESLTVLNEELLQQGLLLESDYPTNEVLDHLRSLLRAGLDGEEVLFRFYDPIVIAPMLNLMQESEKYLFMGNIKTLRYCHLETTITLNNPLHDCHKQHEEPWWVIQPEHLVNSYDLDIHCQILDRRFWNVVPEVMEANVTSNIIIKDALIYASNQQWSIDEAELYALSQLLVTSNSSIADITKKFHLSGSDATTLVKFSEAKA
ncbi:DUF4123 domain-containing protein [Vibrio diazotrophicus]|uniref:DUF4123 domain-containing protein n=1 Tax=Vibrio diazotrophicus TaxID=685 RepID=UPI0022AE9476|nr:DUF4123 domain-containing protein [Vibrio diazotrophicus]MCZ4372955.1 DUF4123 domain-containing protein [Vibrio diazotrophicus]